MVGSQRIRGARTRAAVMGVVSLFSAATLAVGVSVSTAGAVVRHANAVPVPGAVTGLSSVVNSSSQVTLSWTAPTQVGAGIAEYLVSWNAGVNSKAVLAPSTGTTITGLNANTGYTFYVQTVDTANALSATSPSTSATTLYVAPTAPSSLTTSNVTAGAVTLSWIDPATTGSGIQNYTITETPSVSTLTVAEPGTTPTLGSPVTKTVTGLDPNTAYTFSVVANSTDGQSGAAATVSATTKYLAPGAPTAVVASNARLTTVDLAWTAPTQVGSGIQNYTITYPGQLAPQTVTGTSATIAGLNPNTSYTFTVVANATDGQVSSSASSNTITTASTPNPVTNVVATPVNGDIFSLQLNWTAPAGSAGALLNYTVSCTPSCGTPKIVPGTSTTVTFDTLLPLTAYTFSVYATSTSGSSSTAATTTYTTPASYYAAPGDVIGLAQTAATTTSATLSWSAPGIQNVGAGISGYTLTCQPTCGTNTISNTATSYTVTGLDPGVLYTYTIVSNARDHQTSAGATATGMTAYLAPNPVTSPSATTTSSSVTLNWTAPVGGPGYNAIQGYFITCSPACLPQASQGTSVTFTGLSANTTYNFQIQAVDAGGYRSSVVSTSATTKHVAPGSVTALTASGITLYSVNLSWTAPSEVGSGITGYTITYPGQATPQTVSGTSATVSGLTPGTNYTFSVVANSTDTQSSTAATTTAQTTFLAPGPVTALAATGTELTTVNLSWVAPTQVGAGITSYTITYPGQATPQTVNGTSATVAGLTPDTSYTFTVVANASDAQTSASATTSATTAVNPEAVGSLTATGVSSDTTAVDLTWTAPVGSGNAISGYTVTANPGAILVVAGASATSARVTGLSQGVTYTFTVVATATTAGQSSSSVQGAPYAQVPSSFAVVKTAVTASSISLSWTAPVASVDLSGYTITCSPACGSVSALNTATSSTLTGLNADTTYTIAVVANLSDGSGRSITGTPVLQSTNFNPPGSVSNLAGNSANSGTAVTLTWSAPSLQNSGAGGLDYVVTCSPSCGSHTVTGTTTTITGLTPGTSHTFSVVTVSELTNSGDGQRSGAVSVTVVTSSTPGAVTGLTATAASTTSVNLTWTAPASVGAGIASYTITYPGQATPQTVTTTSATVTGLSAGTHYTFTVVANASDAQTSAGATASATTLFTAPGAVTGLKAVSTTKVGTTLTWKAPVNVGAGIAGYTITYLKAGKTVTIKVGASATSSKVTGLTTKSSYTFKVVVNAKDSKSSTVASIKVTTA